MTRRANALSSLFVAILVTPLAVLADRNGSGVYSLPLPPVVAHTTIQSTWANTTLGDIATNLTNSLDRNGRGPMLAPLQLNSGTVAAPGLTFSAETGSGLYRIGAKDIGFALTGTKVLEISGANSYYALVATALPASNSSGMQSNGDGTGDGIDAQSGSTGTASYGVAGFGVGNNAGIYGLGAGTGIGVRGQGGGTNANGAIFAAGGPSPGSNGNPTITGVVGVGSSTGTGVAGFGGGTNGSGGYFGGGAGNGVGLTAQGTGSATGATGIGGPTGIGIDGAGGTLKPGIRGTGGTNGDGVDAFGNGLGSGISATGGATNSPGGIFTGGGTGEGADFSNGTSATGGTRRDAIILLNGDISMQSVANPTSTTPVNNRLTPSNIVKAWGFVTTAGGSSTTCTVNDGFNIASCAADSSGGNAGVIHFTLAQAVAGTTYAVVCTDASAGTLAWYSFLIQSTTQFTCTQTQANGTAIAPGNCYGNVCRTSFVVLARQ